MHYKLGINMLLSSVETVGLIKTRFATLILVCRLDHADYLGSCNLYNMLCWRFFDCRTQIRNFPGRLNVTV